MTLPIQSVSPDAKPQSAPTPKTAPQKRIDFLPEIELHPAIHGVSWGYRILTPGWTPGPGDA